MSTRAEPAPSLAATRPGGLTWVRSSAVGPARLMDPRSEAAAAELDDEEVWSNVVAADRPCLPFTPAAKLLYVVALGPGWIELTDRDDVPRLDCPPVSVGERRRMRPPRGLVQQLWRDTPNPSRQALLVVRRPLTAREHAPRVHLVVAAHLPALLSQVRSPLVAQGWPPAGLALHR